MYTLKKEERLCSKKLIDELFHNGSSFLCYPYKVTWLLADADHPVQVLFSVPKKRYKRAVDRNLAKRRMREAYRLLKQDNLYAHLALPRQLLFSITYVGKEIGVYSFFEKKMLVALGQLIQKAT
ncbi:MAG: ribonuclease P protein component [Sphingobacteriaceae bacterium]